MKKFAPVVCVAACVFALFLAGCSCTINVVTDKNTVNANSNSTPAPTPFKKVQSYEVDGAFVDIQDSIITVKLEGNPTTGFEWTSEITGNNLKAESEDYKSSAKSNIAAGAGGVYTFVFKGEGTGKGTLKFTYARSWEKSEQDSWLTVDVVTKGGTITDTTAKSSKGATGESHS